MSEIVIGVDTSTAAERALDQALVEAELADLPLEVVHAWTPPAWGGSGGIGYIPPLPMDDLEAGSTAIADGVVADALTRRADPTPVTVRSGSSQGGAGRVLVERAGDAPLLVVGGRGHGVVSSTLLGSTTDYVVHHARCPVMVVPELGPPAGRFDRVLVGFDGSPSALEALRWGFAEAQRHHCPLVAVHVLAFPQLPGQHAAFSARHMAEAEEAARTDLVREVASALPDPEGMSVTTQVACGGVSAMLMDLAGPEDLLVLGTRGRSGFSRLVLGSVATQCVQHGRGAVVVVRAPSNGQQKAS